MVRSLIYIAILCLLSFFFGQPLLLYAEEQKLAYFGVGATVQSTSTNEYLVKTKGEKAEEGLVYTPQQGFSKKEITIQVELKGEHPILLKVSETDARGRFIRDEKKFVELRNEWTYYEMPYHLQSTSSQLDVLILTKEKTATEFALKNFSVTMNE